MNLNEALIHVKAELPQGRYDHTVRVVDQALKLAALYGVDTEKTALAAVFHDYAKNWPIDEMKRIILTSQLPKDLLLYHHELWHGPVASILVETQFGISDLDILNAIKYHTTGRSHMTDLEMIICLADYIEPHRNFVGLEEVRDLAAKDLIHAAYLMSKKTIQFLMMKGSPIYPDSFHAYNYLAKQLIDSD